jgi:4-hydroxy-tetrahydrodipicolinate reductase
MTEALRVAQCYTGGVGSEVVRRLVRHPRMELVGVLVHSDAKAGRDAGEVVGIDAVGVTTTQDLGAIIALRPDAVVWSGMGYEPDRLALLLEAGISVYTGLGAQYLRGQPERELLEDACRRGGACLAAGGNIPGLISDVLPAFLSGFTGDVRHITAEQRNHVAHYPSATQVGGLGLGGPLVAATDEQRDFEEMVDRGWEWLMGMSAAMVADALQLPFTRLATRSKVRLPSPEAVTLPGSGLVIEEGTTGGVRWIWDAYTGDRVFLTISNEQTGVLGLGDGWRDDETAPAWTVRLDASPPLVATLSWPEGTLAAEANAHLNAARAVNFLPALVAAPPGCRSVLDLPMITCSDAQP